MTFSDYAEKIEALGRDISPQALMATRAVVQPLIDMATLLDGVTVTRDLRYGTHDRNRLDVYAATGDSEPRPVLLFVHGGGFTAGDKQAEGTPFFANIGAWAVKSGFAGVCMTYRLAPDHPWPAGIEDIRGVIEFIQSNGSRYGLDASKIFILGQSAGAAHAAGYITHPEIYDNADHGLVGAILLSGVYDFVTMPATPLEKAYLGEDESLYQARSSLDGLLETDLPLLVTMAEFDPPKFQAQALQLLAGMLGKWGELPWFVHLLGQNHLSVALYLGLEGDLLGPQLQRFIEEFSSDN